jgi:protein-S-isoprenylcysteine O-methyltransferase Ste14
MSKLVKQIFSFILILFEEPDLEKKFGEEYSAYNKYVNRWLPRFKPYKAQ